MPGQVLSEGQKQRLKLARVLVTPADLWLLDEPLTALDSYAITFLRNAIKKHRGSGGIVVAATHQDLNLKNSKILHINNFSAEDMVFE